jgi:hypothetical protein
MLKSKTAKKYPKKLLQYNENFIVDMLGKPPKIGDYIVYSNALGNMDFQKIKYIKPQYNGITVENFDFLLSGNFLIVNCIYKENPELFI